MSLPLQQLVHDPTQDANWFLLVCAQIIAALSSHHPGITRHDVPFIHQKLTDSVMHGCTLFNPRAFSLHEQLHHDCQAAHTSCHNKAKLRQLGHVVQLHSQSLDKLVPRNYYYNQCFVC